MKGEKPTVLLIYTGGTIGMINDPKTGSLKAFDFRHLSSQIPELERLNVSLSSISFPEPVDSSEMDPTLWASIAQIIYDNYDKHDGFVVLHGSDTMAYTASALSFMLQGLDKPVILTGSQLPIGTIRTDGKENIITAIEIAADKNDDGSAKIRKWPFISSIRFTAATARPKSPPVILKLSNPRIILNWRSQACRSTTSCAKIILRTTSWSFSPLSITALRY